MEQISDLVGEELAERYEAVIRNVEGIRRKLARLDNKAEKAKHLEYQLASAEKGLRRVEKAVQDTI